MTDSPLWVRTSSADQRQVEPVRASKLSQHVSRPSLHFCCVFLFQYRLAQCTHRHRHTHTEFYRPRLFFSFFLYLFFSNSWHAEILWSHWFVAPAGKWCWSSVGGRSPASLTSVTGKNKIHKDQKVIYKGNFKWRIVQQHEHKTGVGLDSLQEELWPCLCDFLCVSPLVGIFSPVVAIGLELEAIFSDN